MTTILLTVVKAAGDSIEAERQWKSCTAYLAERARKNIGVQLLGENVLLISLGEGLSGLSGLIPELLDHSYRYAILSEDTKWIEVPGPAS